MIKVFLREKKLKHGKRGLYLDFYPAILHPETGKQTRREHLRLYTFERPKIEAEKEHNKETRLLAENIRAKRQLEFQAGIYGFAPVGDKQRDFLAYFEEVVEGKKSQSKSNFENWRSVKQYLVKFAKGHCTFGDVTEKFCKDFKEFLLNQESISTNTASVYFDKFKVAVRLAADDKLLAENPARRVRSIKVEDTQREFLTLDELHTLAATPFEYEDMRRAALFAALTGLRFSDIQKLTWKEVQFSEQNGSYLRFTQQKTKGTETLPISEEALGLLGERKDDSEIVFTNLAYWQASYLPIWTNKAGINRKITFHCFRHTYATLQLTFGTDIYTVSKLLGHKNVQTTQIYARVIDQRKQEAANRISLK
ncbi:MAG: site-specific integrase [Acidobacteria bacterium]|nr:site-specific integrase [Acidobacteriota bacterium]